MLISYSHANRGRNNRCMDQSYNFIVDRGRKIFSSTNENQETSFPFQRLSFVIQRGNEICFTNSFDRILQNGKDELFLVQI